MELVIVSGFVVFLPKYLETQFSLGKSQASVFTGKQTINMKSIDVFNILVLRRQSSKYVFFYKTRNNNFCNLQEHITSCSNFVSTFL